LCGVMCVVCVVAVARRSMSNNVNRALRIRDDALQRVAVSPPKVSVERVESFDCSAPGATTAKFVWCVRVTA
jgi:hypothetical protein